MTRTLGNVYNDTFREQHILAYEAGRCLKNTKNTLDSNFPICKISFFDFFGLVFVIHRDSCIYYLYTEDEQRSDKEVV